MKETSLLRIVVADANVLINFMHVSRLGLLAEIPNHRFVVPDHVRAEIKRTDQRAILDDAVLVGWLDIEVIHDIDTIAVFTELIARMGRGEAACIAIAAQRGWFIASDEKRLFLREATSRVGAGRVLTTIDLFVLAIKAGLISVDDADREKAALERKRFTVKLGSFRELVG